MNISDNIKKIRKDNNLSQEALAEKLNVSRQSVSKWEQGLAYPEMDKVLQICKMFNVSMDDLMQSDISEINNQKESKSTFNRHVDSFLAYITKTVKLFASLSFKDKLKCILEQIIIIGVLFIIINIFRIILGDIFQNMFGSLSQNAYDVILTIFKVVFSTITTILGVVIFLHVFKIRYLDYYDESKNIIEEEKPEINEVKPTKKEKIKLEKDSVVIRDPKDSGYSFIKGLLGVIKFIIKVICLFVLMGISFVIVGVCAFLIIIFTIIKAKLLFFGLLISDISFLVLLSSIFALLFGFIFNCHIKKSILAIFMLTSIIFMGIGIGIFSIGLTKIEIVDSDNKNSYKISNFKYEMTNETFFANYYNDITYIPKDISNIEIEVKHSKYEAVDSYIQNGIIHVYTSIPDSSITDAIKTVLKDLNDYKINNYHNTEIIVYASEYNISKIKENEKKYNELEKIYEQRYEEYENQIETYENTINDLNEQISKYEENLGN